MIYGHGKQRASDWEDIAKRLQINVDALRAKLEKAIECLSFYAKDENRQLFDCDETETALGF